MPISFAGRANSFAIAKIIQNPEIVYIDNPKKAKEIEKEIKETRAKFLDYFGTDEIITTNNKKFWQL